MLQPTGVPTRKSARSRFRPPPCEPQREGLHDNVSYWRTLVRARYRPSTNDQVDTWTGSTAPTVTVQRRREHAPVRKALVRPVARKHSRTVRFERISPPAPSLTIGGESNLPKGVVIMSVTVIVRGIFARVSRVP